MESETEVDIQTGLYWRTKPDGSNWTGVGEVGPSFGPYRSTSSLLIVVTVSQRSPGLVKNLGELFGAFDFTWIRTEEVILHSALRDEF